MDAARQNSRGPHKPPYRVGDDLQVHAVPTMLAAVVTAAVADTVTLGECAIYPHVLCSSRLRLAQSHGESWRAAGEECDDGPDVGIRGTDADPEAGRDLDQGGVLAQVLHQRDQGTLMRTQLAPAVTLPKDR